LQFLNITYSAKLPSSSTLDDVRGTLEKFIPEGYYQSEAEFLAHVEKDASSFRPLGKKIHSYTRVAPNGANKGKGNAILLPEDDPDAIVFEVWHVGGLTPLPCVFFLRFLRQRGTHRDFESTTGGCNFSFCSTSKLGHTSTTRRIHGNLRFCRFYCVLCRPQMIADEIRYEKRKRRTTPVTETYHFLGYSSLYPFYCFPDKVRLRLRCVCAP
jgi:histone acetyltransferase 1